MRHALPVITKDDCRGCGACCRHMGHPTFVRPDGGLAAEEQWLTLPEDLKAEIIGYMARMKEEYLAGLREANDDYGEPCCWLGPDGECKNYEHRPQVCRDFEVGGEDCLRFRHQQNIVTPRPKSRKTRPRSSRPSNLRKRADKEH
jgi:Fe-S-cluster containining protein